VKSSDLRLTAICIMVLSSALCALVMAQTSAAANFPPLNTLYHFTPSDGIAFEFSSLIQASDGNFYGVSAFGGAADYGYVYKVSRSTGQITHLHDFTYADGATPRGTLVQGADGELYGTTEAGGANRADWCYGGQFYQKGSCGTAFKVSLHGRFTKLHDFYTAADGYQAAANTGMIQASDGNFYGTALVEFPIESTSIFKMTPDGTVTVLYQFAADESQGYLSHTGLVQGADGYLYGTTSSGGGASGGGASGGGTVFQIGLSGAFHSLYTFQGAPVGGSGDGALPWGKLMQGKDGMFYGTTFGGGTTLGHCVVGGCGTIYKITPAGVETVLYRFTGSAIDGEWPQNAGLAQTPDGTLYGVTGGNPYGTIGAPLCYVGNIATAGCGTLYKIDLAGRFKQVHTLSSGDGAYGLFPMTSMILAGDGNLYGVAMGGGGWGAGTVYRLLRNAATPVIAIDGTSPTGGPPGTSVIINGTGFTGTTQVTFPTGAATPVDFIVDSDNQISIVVPANGVTGAIGVTAPRGTTYSPTLFYLQPTISSIVTSGDTAIINAEVPVNAQTGPGENSFVHPATAPAKGVAPSDSGRR
jgi:uncharacterized repeat protein (TIGR03803 family)